MQIGSSPHLWESLSHAVLQMAYIVGRDNEGHQ